MAVRSHRIRWILGWGIALLGVTATVAGSVMLGQAEDRRLRADFKQHAVEFALAIEHELVDDVQAVAALAGFFEAWGRVEEEEFRRATAHLLARHSSLRALSWNLRVSQAERRAHEAALQRDGQEGYSITEYSPAGELVEAGRRPEYVVVRYIEPSAGNETAVGFDVRSEPRRLAALEHAAATGEVGLTSQISLVQEQTPGFLAFWPIRSSETSREPSPEGRFASFAVGVFHVADLVEDALHRNELDGIAIRIEDITDTDNVSLLYANRHESDATPVQEAPPVGHVATFDNGGRVWRLQFAPGPELLAQHRGLMPIYSLLGGFAITALCTAYLLSLIRINGRLEREIALRTQAERERREIEVKMRQAQKLESLGVLAGGIAHDFNNLLTGMLGYMDLGLTRIPADAPAHEDIEQARIAATRAAELTGQMLAYTGSNPFKPEVVDLSRLVQEMAQLLDSSVSKDARLQSDFPPDPQNIEGDPTQIRQIVMNFITNASEAIRERPGVIALRTGTRHFDRESLSTAYLSETPGPGPHVFLEVSDEGCGMTNEERARVFDPFFSTKFTGRGLGLAAVIGIVRSHRGAIWVASDPGKGSTFTVAFPIASPRELQEEHALAEGPAEWRGSGTVLIVEDEEQIRRLAARLLAELGFDVVTASNGEEALAIFRERPGEILLVLLDVTMPGMSGVEVLCALRELRSDAKVVLCSGYAEEALMQDAAQGPDGFLAKPYTSSDLIRMLRRILSA